MTTNICCEKHKTIILKRNTPDRGGRGLCSRWRTWWLVSLMLSSPVLPGTTFLPALLPAPRTAPGTQRVNQRVDIRSGSVGASPLPRVDGGRAWGRKERLAAPPSSGRKESSSGETRFAPREETHTQRELQERHPSAGSCPAPRTPCPGLAHLSLPRVPARSPPSPYSSPASL